MRTAMQSKFECIARNAIPVLSSTAPSAHATAYDRLMDAIGDAPVVLVRCSSYDTWKWLLERCCSRAAPCLVQIGEASHGTLDFYRERALITQRLIKEKGFNSVIVEADWPDAYRINRHVETSCR